MITCRECKKQVESANLCPHCGYQHLTGKVAISITKEAREALIGFLLTDCEGTGEGYTDFILKAIELRRQVENEPA